MVVAARQREGQERTCAVSRTAMDPCELIRFVAGPDGSIVPDIRRKLPGRGVWVKASAGTVAEAAKKNVFARSLKQQIKPDSKLADLVDRLLLEDALQSLALANKAGAAVKGAFQVEKAITGKIVSVLLHASDGSQDGARKINQVLFRTMGEAANSINHVEFFDSAQLGLALGQLSVIHAALKQGAASDAFAGRARRLARYRGIAVSDVTGPDRESNSE